ncbi:hypothetical protein RJ639_029844 [Escallonia herrerae]|uniref:Uncharacterized protein n=1 Tax=Escallonia herrerae TaxID=1293975 RepID=A0AA89BLK3_9ASTE|nr:hypothetical protein RJ639_029844 [Escallonia herrerae]
MNNLANTTLTDAGHRQYTCKPIPTLAIYVLALLFLIGLAFSIFILAVVHNALFLLLLLSLAALVAAFLLWNSLNWRRNGAVLFYLHSFPDSDLGFARDGDLVKITGLVACGSISLESSYEKVAPCIYTSTSLYEFGELGLKPADVKESWFQWRLVYSELQSSPWQRFSADFYLTDGKSGITVLVKAGQGSKVFPLIAESRLVNSTRKCKILSSHLRKWLNDRSLPVETRLLRLEEGYIKEGSSVIVIGMLRRNADSTIIVQPPALISTGCLLQKFLLPVDVDELILGVPKTADTRTNSKSVSCVEL